MAKFVFILFSALFFQHQQKKSSHVHGLVRLKMYEKNELLIMLSSPAEVLGFEYRAKTKKEASF